LRSPFARYSPTRIERALDAWAGCCFSFAIGYIVCQWRLVRGFDLLSNLMLPLAAIIGVAVPRGVLSIVRMLRKASDRAA
jgi:hypothetical protein